MHEKVLAKNYVLKKGIQIIIYFKQENALSRQSVFMKLIDYFVRFSTIASIAKGLFGGVIIEDYFI